MNTHGTINTATPNLVGGHLGNGRACRLRQLLVKEVLDINRDVALELDYAHDHALHLSDKMRCFYTAELVIPHVTFFLTSQLINVGRNERIFKLIEKN